MGRTATNTLGNCLATAIVGQWEGETNFVDEEIAVESWKVEVLSSLQV